MVRLYNTLSGKKEELPKTSGKKLRLFVCGPTVYDYPHIGHARTYLFFDFLTRFLRFRKYKVSYLQNITDVDDKIINRAKNEGKTAARVSGFFTKAYLEDMKALGVTAVQRYAAATKHIPEIISQVEKLIKKGYVYKIEGDGWYFDISKFKDYGKLSRRTTEQAEDAVSRIEKKKKKRNKGDFCVWKFSKPGEPMWNSPLGAGRPGWHIEDTAISEKYFGPQYELH
ncbi:MAG: class I tRNA ligase family protein, partial [Candidatus Liptonbacteria bacterium]|nr:class I tRNA ligase family protein [Candidatus Liptonbacteria bacterium]